MRSDDWKGVRTLVTGAGGFIGSHLVEELARRGARVRALARYNGRSHWGHLEEADPALKPRIEVILGDVTDPACVRDAVRGCDAVFHLAALIAIPYSYSAPSSYVAVNVGGTLNVLDACRGLGVRRLVCTSTSEVYGTARYVPMDEEHPLNAQSPYAASKIGADQLALSFHRSFGMPVSVIRPFNTYGPRQSARAVLPAILCQLLAGKAAIELGSLTPVRDFNYVADTVSGFLAVAASPKSVGEVINVGSGRGVTIAEAARIAMRAAGASARLRTRAERRRPGASEVRRLIAGTAKARRLLGWRPAHTLEGGLRLSADYIRARLCEYKTDLYAV